MMQGVFQQNFIGTNLKCHFERDMNMFFFPSKHPLGRSYNIRKGIRCDPIYNCLMANPTEHLSPSYILLAFKISSYFFSLLPRKMCCKT